MDELERVLQQRTGTQDGMGRKTKTRQTSHLDSIPGESLPFLSLQVVRNHLRYHALQESWRRPIGHSLWCCWGARGLLSWEGSTLRVLIIISAVALSGLLWASLAAARHIRKARRQRRSGRLQTKGPAFPPSVEEDKEKHKESKSETTSPARKP